ncbi:MAG: hypothetical protein QOG43_1561 [Actinomycetota bacterium]|jgi:hypothetical protein|nr:hypothetical protein [Actinomycetota bacterium]
MDLGDLTKKAKDLAEEHGDKIDNVVEKVTEMAKGRITGHDEQIDSAAAKVKSLLGREGGAAADTGAPQE